MQSVNIEVIKILNRESCKNFIKIEKLAVHFPPKKLFKTLLSSRVKLVKLNG